MKIEIEWPRLEYLPETNVVNVAVPFVKFCWEYDGSWSEDAKESLSSVPQVMKEAEQLWQQHQKLESLTERELYQRFEGLGGRELAAFETSILLDLVKEDRKREAQIRERESGWRPIETAPKNQPFLATDGMYQVVATMHPYKGLVVSWTAEELAFPGDWTHWMPLPEVPND